MNWLREAQQRGQVRADEERTRLRNEEIARQEMERARRIQVVAAENEVGTSISPHYEAIREVVWRRSQDLTKDGFSVSVEPQLFFHNGLAEVGEPLYTQLAERLTFSLPVVMSSEEVTRHSGIQQATSLPSYHLVSGEHHTGLLSGKILVSVEDNRTEKQGIFNRAQLPPDWVGKINFHIHMIDENRYVIFYNNGETVGWNNHMNIRGYQGIDQVEQVGDVIIEVITKKIEELNFYSPR